MKMNSKQRMAKAMHLQKPDRVPVMCQLSIGHYFINSGIDPVKIWLTSEGFAEALMNLRERYNFDGILVNLPGRDPNIEKFIEKIETSNGDRKIYWKDGYFTVIPANDNPHFYFPDGTRYFPTFDEIDPEKLFYVDPWDITEISYPYKWGFEKDFPPFENFFPEYHLDTIKLIIEKAGKDFSIHSEVFSPWSQFLELLNYESALLAIIDNPEKVKKCLKRLSLGAIDLAKRQADVGVDAILISSAFAGGGLISRDQYSEFVLPYEKNIIDEFKKDFDIPIYTHTCGSIGDRLDLMLETGTEGIDTLDPPPLGTVELEEAKMILGHKAFIKGNIDPVNTLLFGSEEQIRKDVEWRINIGKPNGGFILSSACSVSPHTEPNNIKILVELAEQLGAY